MTAYLLRMRSGCDGGGKGPLIQVEKSGTLATNNDQTLFIMKETFYEAHSQDARYKEVDTSPSLTSSMDNQTDVPLVHVYDNHPSDSRVTESKGVCHTLTSKMGTGGGNVPLAVFGKVSRPRGKDGLGERWDEIDVASTRNCMDIGDSRTQEVVTYRIDADASNAMKSSNPNSGVHKVTVSPTLDTTTPTPAKAQGGLAVCIQENLIGRGDNAGPQGIGVKEEQSFTLNATGVHGVSNAGQVRRLTPVECERLQGFPDNYTRIPYRNKPEEQCPDAPRYKAIGNSWAVPCVRWIGKRIQNYLKENK